MNESRTKVICEYYGMENLDFCKEKFKKRERKKIYGKNKRLVWEKKNGGENKDKKKEEERTKGGGGYNERIQRTLINFELMENEIKFKDMERIGTRILRRI